MTIGDEVTIKVVGKIYKMEASRTFGLEVYIKDEQKGTYLSMSMEELEKCQVSSS